MMNKNEQYKSNIELVYENLKSSIEAYYSGGFSSGDLHHVKGCFAATLGTFTRNATYNSRDRRWEVRVRTGTLTSARNIWTT